MTEINVHLGDFYTLVEPEVPEELHKEFSYWHRQLVYDKVKRQRVSQGETRKMYTEVTHIHEKTHKVVVSLTTLPGFASAAYKTLKALGHKVNFIDERTPRPAADPVHACKILRPYQYECAYTALNAGGGIISCPTGYGKCVSIGTKVLMFDGTRKKIEDIKIGEQVMGMGGDPRTVQGTKLEFGPMTRVVPTRGRPFEVADDHILTLINTDTNKLVDIMLSAYLSESATYKRCHKLIKVAVDFTEQPVSCDPYREGSLFGAAIQGSSGYPLSNSFLINSKEIRYEVLAGMIDTCGTIVDGTTFSLTNLCEGSADTIAFLSGSLGLGVSCPVGASEGEFTHSVLISGDTHLIPTRATCNQVIANTQAKNVLHSGFTLEKVSDGEYAGISLDGDHRYLLDVYTCGLRH